LVFARASDAVRTLAVVLRRSFLSAQLSSTTLSLLLFFSPPTTPFDRVIFVVQILQASLSAHLLQWFELRPTPGPVLSDCRGLFPPALAAHLYLLHRTSSSGPGGASRLRPNCSISHFLFLAHVSHCSSYNSHHKILGFNLHLSDPQRQRLKFETQQGCTTTLNSRRHSWAR